MCGVGLKRQKLRIQNKVTLNARETYRPALTSQNEIIIMLNRTENTLHVTTQRQNQIGIFDTFGNIEII